MGRALFTFNIWIYTLFFTPRQGPGKTKSVENLAHSVLRPSAPGKHLEAIANFGWITRQKTCTYQEIQPPASPNRVDVACSPNWTPIQSGTSSLVLQIIFKFTVTAGRNQHKCPNLEEEENSES